MFWVNVSGGVLKSNIISLSTEELLWPQVDGSLYINTLTNNTLTKFHISKAR